MTLSETARINREAIVYRPDASKTPAEPRFVSEKARARLAPVDELLARIDDVWASRKCA